MNEQQLKHILISAAKIGDDNEIIVVGSQSILGQFPEASKNPVLSYSMEADLYLKNKRDNTAYVEGAIGEGSLFHITHGYYAQEVGPETSVLPEGWDDRLFRVEVKFDTKAKVTGYCLEAHDLAVAKYVAGREKDYVFLAVMINKGLLKKKELISRIKLTMGINHHSIIERVKIDFKKYSSTHMNFKAIIAQQNKNMNSTVLKNLDIEKKEFIRAIKNRMGKK